MSSLNNVERGFDTEASFVRLSLRYRTKRNQKNVNMGRDIKKIIEINEKVKDDIPTWLAVYTRCDLLDTGSVEHFVT